MIHIFEFLGNNNILLMSVMCYYCLKSRRFEKKIVVCSELSLIHGGDHELRVVDETTSVSINGVKHSLNLLIRHYFSIMLEVTLLNFLD